MRLKYPTYFGAYQFEKHAMSHDGSKADISVILYLTNTVLDMYSNLRNTNLTGIQFLGAELSAGRCGIFQRTRGLILCRDYWSSKLASALLESDRLESLASEKVQVYFDSFVLCSLSAYISYLIANLFAITGIFDYIWLLS